MDRSLVEIINAITTLRENKKNVLVAIDGRCSAGKTTFAKHMQDNIDCNVIHMDDFFLRPEQRTPERYQEAGGNVDYERFLNEVMLPLQEGVPFSFRPYDCKQQKLKNAIQIEPTDVTIIEGSYSCHPNLWDFYDLRIFINISENDQFNRIIKRNGEESLKIFKEKWIPLEEKYFSTFEIEDRCDYSIILRQL